MRLTATEWSEKLRRVLGGLPSSSPSVLARVATEIYDDGGRSAPSVLAYDDRVYSLTTGQAAGFVQVIPRGYYDTIAVGWADTSGAGGDVRPILVIPGLLAPSEGPHAWNEIASSQAVALASHPPLFADTPSADLIGSLDTLLVKVSSSSLVAEMPLTNMPFAVAIADLGNPDIISACSLRVAMLSVRH